MYLALRQHFTRKTYDYFKYNGKVKTSQDHFSKRRDKYYFAKLAKHEDLQGFLVANFLESPNQWIGDLLKNPVTNDTYLDWKKRQQSLLYQFQNHILLLPSIKEAIVCKDGNLPLVITLFLQRKISIETLVILTDCLGCHAYWSKELKDNVIWSDWIGILIKKYKPFLKYDRDIFMTALKKNVQTS